MLIQKNTSEHNITGLEHLALQEYHWTAQITSMMAQSDGNDETDGISDVAGQTHTDEMVHRLLAFTGDLKDRNTTPKAKTALKLTLSNVLLPNYLRIAQIPKVHNTSV